MLNNAVERVEQWTERWTECVAAPRQAFRGDHVSRITPFEFFAGNLLCGYVVILATSILYFIVFFRRVFANAIWGNGALLVTSISIFFAGYVILNFIASILVSITTYTIYRVLGSRTTLKQQIELFLTLSFLEPVAAFSTTIFILAADREDSPMLAFVVAGFLFVATRIWYLWVATTATPTKNELPRLKRVVGFLGFGVSYFILNIALVGITWLLIAAIVTQVDMTKPPDDTDEVAGVVNPAISAARAPS